MASVIALEREAVVPAWIAYTPALGTNLVAAPIDSTRVLILKAVSLWAAALNIIMLVWLVVKLALVDTEN